MSNITPFFEVSGNRYEIKKTRYLIAEYDKLRKESPASAEDKENLTVASNLVADVKKFAEKEQEWWDVFCENPTTENKNTYLMFKELSDNAISRYNEFVSKNNTLEESYSRTINVLEKLAIKALAEQYFGFNEVAAKQTWEQFVDQSESHDYVANWLNAMAECLFGSEEEEEDNSFLAQKRKMDKERENARKSAVRKKR